MDDNLLLIGKISKPHGVAGRVKTVSYAESAETFRKLSTLHLKGKDGSFHLLHINSVGSSGGLMLLGFDEIRSREEAKGLAGCELFVDKEKLEELPEGEYYRHQLIGLDVMTAEGVHLGKIKGIIETGSNDVLVVRKGETEHLVPALKDVIRDIDLEKGQMVIEPIETGTSIP